MGRPPIDLGSKIKGILDHVEELPPESSTPLAHYRWSVGKHWSLRRYVAEKIHGSDHYAKVRNDHLAALDRMLLVNVIEAFERFLKEIGAACINHVADCVLDGRLDGFKVNGSQLAAHFEEETLGEALCESSTWLDCDEINKRFRLLLADPPDPKQGKFYVFPSRGQSPEDERFRHEIMSLIWQLRHTIVHNVGVITKSDSVKLKLLARTHVTAPSLLRPTLDDLRYVKQFLDETAATISQRVCDRLTELLTTLHSENPKLFKPLDKAQDIARDFDRTVEIAGATANP